VDKNTDIVLKEYVDFTIDFKNDRGKIYMGCVDDYYDSKSKMYQKKKPTVIFTMRD
jgi:hypothetical protein